MIAPFRFDFPTRVAWGPAPEAIAAHAAGRVLLVSDPGVVAAGLVAPIQDALDEVRVTAEVSGNPTTADLDVVSEVADGAVVIVAVGGGSVIDVAKAAAMLATNGGNYADYQWHGRPITERSLPLIAVPTTAGTGSEVTRVAVIADPTEHLKKGVLSPLMFPHVAVLDPGLTTGLPPGLTAATGIDAFSHALEAYLGRRASPVSDMLALESLRLCAAFLPRAVADGTDAEAREQMMLAAMYGGIAMDQAGLGLVHALSGGLCSHLDLHHGAANARLLPYVVEFNEPAIPEGRADVLRDILPASLADFIRSLGLTVGLGDQPVADWAGIAALSMRMAMIPNNPRDVTEEDCLAILHSMTRARA